MFSEAKCGWLVAALDVAQVAAMRLPVFILLGVNAAVSAGCSRTPSEAAAAFTVGDARHAAPVTLARTLLGERLAARVVAVERQEREDGSHTPRAALFFSRPEAGWPRYNGICRTDVVTIEYDWYDHDRPSDAAPLTIAHVEAASRYMAVPEPPGDPGSDAYDRAHAESCRRQAHLAQSFVAPSAGDAQWLAAIRRDYAGQQPSTSYKLTCHSFNSDDCSNVSRFLPILELRKASVIEQRDCPAKIIKVQVRYCYRLVWKYSGRNSGPEWIMAVDAAMHDGSSPILLETLAIEHQPRPFVFY